jgi:hypothetical protein
MCDFHVMKTALVLVALSVLTLTPASGSVMKGPIPWTFCSFQLAAGAHDASPEPEVWENLTPEQRMQRRWPQPVKVGFLIGLPILDWDDSTIGHIRKVVRTADGKIQLIVDYGGWLTWKKKPVAVPIETVAILARQINLLDMTPEDLEKRPTWSDSVGQDLAPDVTIRIAIARR